MGQATEQSAAAFARARLQLGSTMQPLALLREAVLCVPASTDRTVSSHRAFYYSCTYKSRCWATTQLPRGDLEKVGLEGAKDWIIGKEGPSRKFR